MRLPALVTTGLPAAVRPDLRTSRPSPSLYGEDTLIIGAAEGNTAPLAGLRLPPARAWCMARAGTQHADHNRKLAQAYAGTLAT